MELERLKVPKPVVIKVTAMDYSVGDYMVSFNAKKKIWSCECKGFIFYGMDREFNCKHIKIVKKMLDIKDV